MPTCCIQSNTIFVPVIRDNRMIAIFIVNIIVIVEQTYAQNPSCFIVIDIHRHDNPN